jgi:hypothetical protein
VRAFKVSSMEPISVLIKTNANGMVVPQRLLRRQSN